MLWNFLITGSGKDVAAGAEVPLEIPNPEHHVGYGRGPRVDLDTQELVRVHGCSGQVQQRLTLAESFEGVQHLTLQAFQVLEGDIEKIAAAACRIEHADCAQLVVELLDQRRSARLVSLVGKSDGGCQDRLPL